MPLIRQLSASVVNKIAAGEVIERPASVVKELVENSVDAGAGRIEVAILKGGSELIRVTDDGCGISSDQLELAVASHATSKICDADDLFHVTTLGFRGEALASIAEVSQFRIRSRTAEETAGTELEVNGGSAHGIAPCGCAVGTTIEVRNLFFNTPVRRKFLRTTQTEMGHITEALTRIALAHDDVHFVLLHNGRPIHELAANTDWRTRIGTLFGRELSESLIWIDSGAGPLRVYGYVADPAQNRSHNRMQYIFLNRRHIRDRTLMHALTEAYRGLIMTGRYPIAFLRLDMPPDAVDVNVHPTKLEVRFQDSGEVYQKLLGTIRNRFLRSDLTARARLVDRPAADNSQEASARENPADGPSPAGQPTTPAWINRPATGSDTHESAVPQLPGAPAASASPAAFTGPVRHPIDSGAHSRPAPHLGGAAPQLGLEFERKPLPQPWSVPVGEHSGPGGDGRPGRDGGDGENGGGGEHREHSGAGGRAPASAPALATRTPEGAPALQVYNRYLITETEEGVAVIDQHALHERVLYEQLRAKVLSSSLEVQRLLVPEPVPLSPSEAAVILERRDDLARLGFEVEPFGGDTVLVLAYPAMLVNLRPSEVVREVAELLRTPEKQAERRDLIDSLLHMMSCKAAVKAGDRLTEDEIAALIQHRHVVQDAHHCPHGRPTTLIFTRDELDRRFKRT